MNLLNDIHPSIRVANYYRFRRDNKDNKSEEMSRLGYCYAFHLFDNGRGKVIIEGTPHYLHKGDLLFIPPERLHNFYSEPEHPLSSYNIYLELWPPSPPATNQHLSRPFSFEKSLLTKMNPCAEIDQLATVIHLQHHVILTDLLVHIVQEQQKDDIYSKPIVNHLLTGWLLQLVQISKSNVPYDHRIRQIINLMEQKVNPISDYNSWLQYSGLKKTQFHQLFKQITGLSPKSYWIKNKMKQAAACLLESNRTVTEIATELGYPSIHYFTNQFSTFYGVSPTSFRKRRMR